MNTLFVLFLAFSISFIGSIPPGVINVTVMKYGIKGQLGHAYYFILGVVVIELIYGFVAVRFGYFLTTQSVIQYSMSVISSITLMLFGASSFYQSTKKSDRSEGSSPALNRTPFVEGVLISTLNPMAITFWLGVTTYLLSMKFINLKSYDEWVYLLGIGLGTAFLLALVANLSSKFAHLINNKWVVYYIPGATFIFSGLLALVDSFKL